MTRRRAAVFCMPDRSHFQRLRPVIAELSRAGLEPVVFTHERFRPAIEVLGGRFADLFSCGSIDAADADSWPHAMRFVTFAATYGERLAREARRWQPALVVHDTFAVIGRVVAERLGLPRVNVCAGHNVTPDRYIPIVESHPRMRVSSECARAVERLRRDFSMADASPFSYIANLSPDLNLSGEPPEFLDPEDRAPFEPLAFFGSLIDDAMARDAAPASRYFHGGRAGGLNVYVSFGTVVLPYRAEEACGAFTALAEAASRQPHMNVVISLAGATMPAESSATLAGLARDNVRVEPEVDQWRMLQQADAFVTHHGLNSTHESVFHRVPMLSYPFIWDQPGQAATCQRLGLAVPLGASPMARLSPNDVDQAFARLLDTRAQLAERLGQARAWEEAVIAGRAAIIERIVAL